MFQVVLGIADEPVELPRHLLVRAVLVNQVRPGEQGTRTGAGLLTRQCVHLEVQIGRVLLEPAEKPRLAEDDGGPFLAEGIFGIAERQAGDLVLQHQIAKERKRRDHLRAVRIAGGLFHIRTQQTGAPRVRELVGATPHALLGD